MLIFIFKKELNNKKISGVNHGMSMEQELTWFFLVDEIINSSSSITGKAKSKVHLDTSWTMLF